MPKIYQPKIRCKDGGSYFYKNKKYRRSKKEKNVFVSYFISGIPKFFYMGFFRKYSMFRRSIPLSSCISNMSSDIKQHSCKVLSSENVN